MVWHQVQYQSLIFWPKSQYFLNFHYGYSARSESSESAKFKQFLKEWGITILTLIVALVILIVFVASFILTGGTITLAVPAIVIYFWHYRIRG